MLVVHCEGSLLTHAPIPNPPHKRLVSISDDNIKNKQEREMCEARLEGRDEIQINIHTLIYTHMHTNTHAEYKPHTHAEYNAKYK